MNIVAGILFALHAFAHLVGFLGAFRLTASVPHSTTLFFGRLDVGEPGARAGGVAWLVVAVAFSIASAAAFADAPWWPRYVLVAATASLVLCVLFLPDTRVGLFINIALLVIFALGRAAFWWMVRD